MSFTAQPPTPTRLLNKNYLLLWQGQAVSMLGASLSRMALILWITEATGSATMMGTLLMVAALPNIFVGPIAGAVADRFSRIKIIVACDILSGLLSLLMALSLGLYADMPGPATAIIFGIYLCLAVITLFFNGAVVALTPDLVPPDRVTTANALEMAVVQLVDLAGKGIGAVMFRLLGGPVIFVIDGLSFLFSAGCENLIRTAQNPPGRLPGWGSTLRQLVADTREGFHFVMKNPGLRGIILVYGGLNFCMEPFFVLLPFYVKDPRFLNAPIDWTGYLFAGLALGTTIGYWAATLLPKRGRGIGWLMICCMAATSLGYTALALVRQEEIGLLLMTVNGMLTGLNSNYVYSQLQTKTPPAMRARVLSVLTALVMCVSPLAMGIAGVVADALDHRLDLIFFFSGAMMFAVVIWGSAQREFRRFMTGETGEAEGAGREQA